MPSLASATVDVPAPLPEAWAVLSNLENAAAWHPGVAGAAAHVRAPHAAAEESILPHRL